MRGACDESELVWSDPGHSSCTCRSGFDEQAELARAGSSDLKLQSQRVERLKVGAHLPAQQYRAVIRSPTANHDNYSTVQYNREQQTGVRQW